MRHWGLSLLTVVLGALAFAGPGEAVAVAVASGEPAAVPARAVLGQEAGPADPFGNFEGAAGVPGGIAVRGWMIDPDLPDPWYVWVSVDGRGQHLFADRGRSDVGAAYPAHGPRHGFRGVVPAGPGTRRVCVTASNYAPAGTTTGSHVLLGCRTVTVPSAAPIGNLERATGGIGSIEIKGWMADPSAPTARLYGWVTIDGVGRHVLTNDHRADVAAALPGYGPGHGFRHSLPAAPGTHRVCVTAANVGPGEHTLLGCATVRVAPGLPHSLTFDSTTCGRSPGFAETVTGVRFAQRDGFTRVVFDFAGEVPACHVAYWDDRDAINVVAYFVDTGNAYEPGIFDAAGLLPVDTTSVESVWAGQMAGGSGEWWFRIDLAVPERPFHAFALGNPSRLVVDIGD